MAPVIVAAGAQPLDVTTANRGWGSRQGVGIIEQRAFSHRQARRGNRRGQQTVDDGVPIVRRDAGGGEDQTETRSVMMRSIMAAVQRRDAHA